MAPYKSLAQERWAHTADGTKALGGTSKVKEWDSASRGLSLPKKLKAPKIKKMADGGTPEPMDLSLLSDEQKSALEAVTDPVAKAEMYRRFVGGGVDKIKPINGLEVARPVMDPKTSLSNPVQGSDSGIAGHGVINKDSLSAAGTLAGNAVSDLDSSGTDVGTSAVSGALKGAATGAQFGPWGALVGGVVSGIGGAISASKKQKMLQQAKNSSAMADALANQDKPNYVGKSFKHGGAPIPIRVQGAEERIKMKAPSLLNKGGTPSYSKGGNVEGAGTAKSDSISANIDATGFIVPAENNSAAQVLREMYLGGSPAKKAKLASGGSGKAAVKLSDGEHYFTGAETALLKSHGIDLNKLAPNAKPGNKLAEGTYSKLKTALGKSENSGKTSGRNQIGAIGKYQFTPDTLKLLGYSDDEIKKFESDPKLQEDAMDKLIASNEKTIKNNKWDKLIGQKIGDTVLTKEGLLAALHLGGATSVKKWIDSNGKTDIADANGTHVSDYAKKFATPDNIKLSPATNLAPAARGIPLSVERYPGLSEQLRKEKIAEAEKTIKENAGYDIRSNKEYQGMMEARQKSEYPNQPVVPVEAPPPANLGGDNIPTITEKITKDTSAQDKLDAVAAGERARALDDSNPQDKPIDATVGGVQKMQPIQPTTDATKTLAGLDTHKTSKFVNGTTADGKPTDPALLLAGAQTGLGFANLVGAGKRPVDSVDKNLLNAEQQSIEEANYGLPPAEMAKVNADLELTRRTTAAQVLAASGGDQASAFGGLQEGQQIKNRGVIDLGIANQREMERKKIIRNSLIDDVANRKRQLFEDNLRGFDNNQGASADLINAGIGNIFGVLGKDKYIDSLNKIPA